MCMYIHIYTYDLFPCPSPTHSHQQQHHHQQTNKQNKTNERTKKKKKNRRPAFVASKSLFVAWQLLDHLRFFQVLKWAPGDVARTRRISFGCFTFSCLIEFVVTMIRLKNVSSSSSGSSSSSDSRSSSTGGSIGSAGNHATAAEIQTKGKNKLAERCAKQNKLKRQSLRAALMTITYAHVSELYPNHDTICGAAGLVTSIMDVKDLWPK